MSDGRDINDRTPFLLLKQIFYGSFSWWTMSKTMRANHIQGAALAIVHNEEVFYTQGYGAMSDGRDINDRTPFLLLR